MRLIDADKLILHLNDYALQEAPFRGESADTYNVIKQCIEAVEEQPTAYDVDKVVKQLRKDKFIDCETVLSDVHQGYNAGLSRAIDIVKAGRKNDD